MVEKKWDLHYLGPSTKHNMFEESADGFKRFDIQLTTYDLRPIKSHCILLYDYSIVIYLQQRIA